MRRTTMVAALVLAATPALWAQATPATRPETVFVKGTVTGEPPCPMKCRITGSKSVYIMPEPTMVSDTTTTSAMARSDTTMSAKPKPTARRVARPVRRGATKAGSNVSKTATKTATKRAQGTKAAATGVKTKTKAPAKPYP